MRLFQTLTILGTLGCVIACAPSIPPARNYTAPETAQGRLCTYACRQTQNSCLEMCHKDERGCYRVMQKAAIDAYENYATAQLQAHKPLERQLHDFEKPEECIHQGCRNGCQSDYDDCYESCGGRVITEPETK